MEHGHNGTCLYRTTFTVPRIWSPEDPNFKYLYEMKHAALEKKLWPLAFLLQVGFTVPKSQTENFRAIQKKKSVC
jgi:hypothetical protein